MSNQINPFNYNIDNFDSGILGPISDNDFRTYLFTHNLPVVNNVISGVLGGNPWQDRGTEYNIIDTQTTPNVVDVPNLQDVAQIPSFYNNLTNPRQVNLSSNLQNLNPEVQNVLGQNTPIQAGLGQDVTTQFNTNSSNIDLPSPEDVAQIPSNLNNFTEPRRDNLAKNPTPLELITWYPIEFGIIYQAAANNYNTSYGVPQTLKLGFVGNVESWVGQAGTVTTASEVRDNQLFSPANNKWGPNEMVSYSFLADELVTPNTGLIQYNTGVQGDFRDQLFSRTLGVGAIPFSTIGSGINFKPDGTNISELDKIARKQRGVEVLNRIKLNFTDSTIGALNVSPFNLLAGGNLIEQNYSITVPKTKIGKAAQFAADLAGFNLPTSIIPTGEVGNLFGLYNIDGTSPDITGILDYTGSGQKSLLYNALYINKYGPILNANPPTTKLGKIIKEKLGAGQAPNTQNYLNYKTPETLESNNGTRKNSLINDINEKVKEIVGKSSENAENLRSTVFEDYSASKALSDKYGSFYGRFEPLEAVGSDLAEEYNFNEGGKDSEYNDKDKNLTTYVGTDFEVDNWNTFVTDERFDWRARKNNQFKKGLLKYTQQLVNDSSLGSAAGYIGYYDSQGNTGALVDGKHQTGVPNFRKPTNPSKGNVARNFNYTTNTGGDHYCRSWSSRRKYHTYQNLIRKDGNWWRSPEKEGLGNFLTLNYEGLNGGDYTGLPKIAWNDLDNKKEEARALQNFSQDKGQLIPYMFSIENLAWKDAPHYRYLPPCEKGPNGGRIMWFPPYDINFDDNTTVNWDPTSFIGRGEPIYTYNSTERSGTLSWSIVVDHSNALNQLREKFKGQFNQNDEYIHSYFAGCDNETLKSLFSNLIPDTQETPDPTPAQVPELTPKQPNPPPSNNLKLYFENSFREGPEVNGATAIGRDPIEDLLNRNYEGGGSCQACGGSTFPPLPSLINVNVNEWQNDGNLYPCGPAGTGTTYQYLNEGKLDQLIELAKFLANTEDGKNYKIEVVGYTSAANPTSDYNKQLGLDRAINTKQWLYALMEQYETPEDVNIQGNPSYGTYPREADLIDNPARWAEPISKGTETGTPSKCKSPCDPGNPCDSNLLPGQANSREAKINRYAEIILKPNLELQTQLLQGQKDQQQQKLNEELKQKIREKEQNERAQNVKYIANGFVTECEYFQHIKRTDPFVYTSLADKIKNFHPAFHSMTPEGFNSRLTFLQQCTRQGPQFIDPGAPQNMVFGRPPICVLRIGDFYHTKIVVDNVNITYEPLVWDLNPEGIGVQPMIAKVSMGFKFIGGSSLGGPIKQLQNAVSYNFFANTSVYKPAVRVIDDKYDFIFGAFKKPDDEKIPIFENIEKLEKQSAEENKDTANTNQTKGAETTQDEQNKIAEETPTSTTTGTEGSNNPVSPQAPASSDKPGGPIELEAEAESPDQSTACKIADLKAKGKINSSIPGNYQLSNITVIDQKISKLENGNYKCYVKIKVEQFQKV